MKRIFLTAYKFLVVLEVIFLISACTHNTSNNFGSRIFEEKTPEYTFSIRYPIINNDDVKNAIAGFISDEFKAFNKSALTVCNLDVENTMIVSSYNAFWELVTNSDKYFSIRFCIYIDWSNAPNPVLYYKTINYDKKIRKIIALSDIVKKYFNSDQEAAEALRKICKKKLYNEMEVECGSFWKSEKDINTFEFMNIKDDGIVFIFDDYILDSHICGNPVVYIPFKDIQE